ncbi:hypothetical protein Tco_1018868 [Tanacetum coccineum]|uniref:Transposase, Ptta/En/Spm, transposase, Tnp1/En/Spm-like protein n=1 Tax=Tanacetum coccineum TaxID=301880 RepID=A0ABQ5FWZ8_9ASTR
MCTTTQVFDGEINLPYLDIFTIHRGLPIKGYILYNDYVFCLSSDNTTELLSWELLMIDSVMSSASSAVTYTSIYIDSKPGRSVAPPSPDYIPGPRATITQPVHRAMMSVEPGEPMFHTATMILHSPVCFLLPESQGYVTESDPEEDPKEYEDDETEDGPVDYPMDGGEDGDDDDGDSSRDDANDEDGNEEDEEEVEEHLAPADSAVVVSTVELVSPPEGTLALESLQNSCNLFHQAALINNSEIYKGKKKRVKSIALKAKKESSDDETSTSRSDDEEYAMTVRNFKKFFGRKGKFVRQPREEKKAFRQRDAKKRKNDRKFFSDSKNDAEDKTNDKTCLMALSSNEVNLNSSYYSDNASFLDNDNMQIKYDNLCEISLKIINKNKTLKIKRDLLEKEVLELNEKIKKLKRSKEIDITCKLCQELKLENAILKETQVKFVKFDKSVNSLREMLNNKKPSSCKIGLGFDSSKASTSGTKPISFVGSSAENATNGSTIKVHGFTISGSVNPSSSEKAA